MTDLEIEREIILQQMKEEAEKLIGDPFDEPDHDTILQQIRERE